MHMAYARGADRIWIVNVGDLKPLEIPISHFMDMAYDAHTWDVDSTGDWAAAWAAREFGSAMAPDISDIMVQYGIMERAPLPGDRRKIEYRLTEKGEALLPTMVALRQWGERWETGVPAFPVLVDHEDKRPIQPVAVRAHDGRVLAKKDLLWALLADVVHDEPHALAAE